MAKPNLTVVHIRPTPEIRVEATAELLEALRAATKAGRHDLSREQRFELEGLALAVHIARVKAVRS